MIDGIRFEILTREEEELIGVDPEFHVTGVALNDQNQCVSISSQYWTERYKLCNDCQNNCSIGGIVWTHPDYQNRGIFTMLFFWTREQAGIEKTYISKNDPLNLLLADKFNLSIPQNINELPSLGNTYKQRLYSAELADKITQIFQSRSV